MLIAVTNYLILYIQFNKEIPRTQSAQPHSVLQCVNYTKNDNQMNIKNYTQNYTGISPPMLLPN